MGDRCNVAIRVGDNRTDHVWLYSHWGGCGMPNRLLTAMRSNQAKARLDDPGYLCRILLDRLITDHEGETGYGVSLSVADNEHPVIEVDIPDKVIRVHNFDRAAWAVDWSAPPIFEESFANFIARETFEWPGNEAEYE